MSEGEFEMGESYQDRNANTCHHLDGVPGGGKGGIDRQWGKEASRKAIKTQE